MSEQVSLLSVAACAFLGVAFVLIEIRPCYADSVTPTDRVPRAVTVFREASADSDPVGSLLVGKTAALEEDVRYWFKVSLSNGTKGYVSKAWTVLVPDEASGIPTTPEHDSTAPAIDASTSNGAITVRRVSSVNDLTTAPPPEGAYRIHLIDVGTGLSILVQGHDFNLLFDGGSKDEKGKMSATGNRNRLLAYLFAALGPSGPDGCEPDGDDWTSAGGLEKTIQHLILSHPHEDHNSLLPDVLHCYRIENVWDSGVINPREVHEAYVAAVAAEPAVRYHTAAPVPDDHTVVVREDAIKFPAGIDWSTFKTGDRQTLGTGARFMVVHGDGVPHGSDFNRNSVVLRLDLGKRSLLLTGDTESGERRPPSAAVGRAEKEMLEDDASVLDVDVLQVAHHGSKTSSRREFLDAVSPHWSLVSSGPFKYTGVKLPDTEILSELREVGSVILATDENDGRCPVEDRIGVDGEKGPGGCDNFVLEIAP